MSFRGIKTFYWVTFGLSVIILALNFGLGLLVLGLLILPVLIIHLTIGLKLDKFENYKTSIILSAINLLAFALIRPDGIHTLTDNGLSSVLGIFGIFAGYNRKYENYFEIVSLVLLLIQAIMDLRLRKFDRANK